MPAARSTRVNLPPFQQLLDRHSGEVFRFLAASVGPVDAEDAFQETFLSALRAYPRLRDASNLRAWLFQIAHRKALDVHRGRARNPLPVEQVPEQVAAPRGAGEPALWRAVRRLPDKQRTAVFLRFAADLDYAQIGMALECSEPAARQNVRAGLATIREGWARA
ncbi:MAG TPA: sigma-70 family RNA polymerase sigma factor [Gaiellales bacterium]|jgi:RNA polymerase sigma factor (sigma-70 family)